MLKRTHLLLTLATTLTLTSQNSKLSLELSYPLVVVAEINKFDGVSYRGLIDLGTKYDFKKFGLRI